MHPDQIPPIAPQPMDATELAELRCALDDPRHASVGPVDKLIAAHDYYRARCEILASDITEKHTAERVLAYALTRSRTDGRAASGAHRAVPSFGRITRTVVDRSACRMCLTTQEPDCAGCTNFASGTPRRRAWHPWTCLPR